jgi:ubiquinone/menaquinone biosynthesis C-methylase UbiE
MEKEYLRDLEELKTFADGIPNTPMMALAKIDALIVLNMRYERIMLDRNLATHPYALVSGFVRDARLSLQAWKEIGFIENPTEVIRSGAAEMEQGHQQLFQHLWVNFSKEEYEQRIERYVHRLRINGLGGNWLKGMACIDFGCGHGNFAHALVREGAAHVYGIDYGPDSIEYATGARDSIGVGPDRIEFKVESVYEVSKGDNTFDFALQNGVFHHLDNEDKAYREVWRVLKPGGWFWIYTDGSGGISYDLWDASVHILKQVPHEFIISHLRQLNIETGKRYHLGDGLNAIYRHTTWAELTGRLSKLGFGNFRRLAGGFPTDFDPDIIAQDTYGHEKFGEGDLRLLAQKMEA